MKKIRPPSVADLIFAIAAPMNAIRGAVKLTQSDGDLAAHIRMGNAIIEARRLPAESLASYTAGDKPLIAHAWLSELLFTALYRLGGLSLIAVVTGLAIATTHGLIAVFLRRRGADARWVVVAALISLALGASHWLARPHMFSILGSALTLFLLESQSRWRAIMAISLFGLWANLHGGWMYGLVVIGAYITGDLIEAWLASDRASWLSRARRDAVLLLAGGSATLLNPYGPKLHLEVLDAITSSSLAGNIVEYMSPNFQDFTNYPFLITLVLCVALLSLSTKRMPLPWLLVVMLGVFASLRSFRNVALFSVTGWPLIALHVSRAWPEHRRAFPFFRDFARIDASTPSGRWAIPVAALLLVLGLNHGRVGAMQVIPDRFDSGILPVEAVRRASEANLPGRVFHPWVWGGYLMYAWPGKAIHVDPLKFSDETMRSYTIIDELRPGWQEELRRWNVQLVIWRPNRPLTVQLAQTPGWELWYTDSAAAVFRRLPSR